MKDTDHIELVFENQNPSINSNEKPYRVIKIKLNENIKLSKYVLKRVLIKKNLFEMYPTLDKFLK